MNANDWLQKLLTETVTLPIDFQKSDKAVQGGSPRLIVISSSDRRTFSILEKNARPVPDCSANLSSAG